MDEDAFNELLSKVGPLITKQDSFSWSLVPYHMTLHCDMTETAILIGSNCKTFIKQCFKEIYTSFENVFGPISTLCNKLKTWLFWICYS